MPAPGQIGAERSRFPGAGLQESHSMASGLVYSLRAFLPDLRVPELPGCQRHSTGPWVLAKAPGNSTSDGDAPRACPGPSQDKEEPPASRALATAVTPRLPHMHPGQQTWFLSDPSRSICFAAYPADHYPQKSCNFSPPPTWALVKVLHFLENLL